MERASDGLFAVWQPRYAVHGVATFPVRGKRPCVRGYLCIGAEASRRLVENFGGGDAFGFALRSANVVVVDIDSPDERLLTEALERHGPTPLIVRSGGGNFQAWHRRTNEARRIRPDPSRPIDILGDGFAVAPPSAVERGSYRIIQGALDDLERLPRLRGAPPAPEVEQAGARSGQRNETLWRACMEQQPHCDNFEALLDVACTLNEGFVPPLEEAEVVKTARLAWGYGERGENRIARRVVVSTHAEIDGLLHEDPDAFVLLTILRRHHWGRHFVVANAMAEKMPGGGWSRKRLSAAGNGLTSRGLLTDMRPASMRHGPALYRLKSGRS